MNTREYDASASYKSINWNVVEDMVDKLTWEKLTSQFWLDTRMVPSNDKADWSKLNDVEKTLYNKVFGGLTMLDTLQGEDGN
ncbi:ribonucleotide-diphosphate reductase subunit beta, partial [Jeotgalibaca porci]